jgi:CRP-like cAMP-binding protein
MLCVVEEQVRSALIEHGDRVRKEKGELLFQTGKTSSGIYLVVSGRVQTSLGIDSKGTRIAEAGSLLGVPATINGAAYSITATVKEDAELIHVSRAQLLELMRTNPAVALSIIDLLSREVRELRLVIKSPKRSDTIH